MEEFSRFCLFKIFGERAREDINHAALSAAADSVQVFRFPAKNTTPSPSQGPRQHTPALTKQAKRGSEETMGNDMGRSANRMAIGAMANATHFEKKELLRLQVGDVMVVS